MVYRIIKYTGESVRALELRLQEIKDREEQVIIFSIETWENK